MQLLLKRINNLYIENCNRYSCISVICKINRYSQINIFILIEKMYVYIITKGVYS